MSCLITDPEIRELTKKLVGETIESVKGLIGIWQERNNKSLDEYPTAKELNNLRIELRKSTTTPVNLSEWVDRNGKKLKISTEGYRKGDPQKNSDVAYVFTENAQAYVTANRQDDSWIEEGYNKGGKVKLKVSDVNGTNQAGIRTDKDGNLSENAFGVVVKKYQQKEGVEKFLTKEGQFQDTDEDFELFKSLNIDMFERLDKSGLKKIVFPFQMARGKAALPKRFAEWLAQALNDRFGVVTTIKKNSNANYDGYGLSIDSIQGSTSQDNTSQPTSEPAEIPVPQELEELSREAFETPTITMEEQQRMVDLVFDPIQRRDRVNLHSAF